MSKKGIPGIILVCVFFVIVFTLAFTTNRHFPTKVISGESSVGTWMSGALLMICAATSLLFGMQQQNWKWYLITAFFLLLSADEHFMFHEQIKEYLIFADPSRSRWVYELPVLAGATAGAFITYLLWSLLQAKSRLPLVVAVVFGTLSAGMDVMSAGVLFEDTFKLLGELAVTCALLLAVD